MTAGSYLLGVTLLGVVSIAAGSTAVRLRRRLVPSASGSAALLYNAIVAVSLLVIVSEILGAAGQLRRWPLVLSVVALAAVLHVALRWTPPSSDQEANPRLGRVALWTTIVVLAVAAQWVAWTAGAFAHGSTDTDTLRYHLPLAAQFARTGSITHLQFVDVDALPTYDPLNVELLHADGMVLFGRDILSPALNLAWLALALLGAWTAGKGAGVQAHTLTATCCVAALPILALTGGGGATNDMASLALLIAAVVPLLEGISNPGAILMAGLAAGLALGTKFSLVAPVGALGVGIALLAGRRAWGKALAIWLPAVVLTSSFWYLRNWARAGSPLPEVNLHLGLTHVSDPVLHATGFSIAHYAGRFGFWRHVALPGLFQAFGPVWWLLLALAVIGVVIGISSAHHSVRLVGAVAAVGAIAYIFTPYSAGGTESNPYLFAPDLRFIAPAVGLGLITLCLAIAHLPWARNVVLALFVVLVLGTMLARSGPYRAWPSSYVLMGILVGAILGAILLLRMLARDRHLASRAMASLGILALIGAGFVVQRHYLRNRYTSDPIYALARTVRDSRIGIVDYPLEYPLYGLDLSNTVIYIGELQRGSLQPITTCSVWRQTLATARVRYLVIGPARLVSPPPTEKAWTQRLFDGRVLLTEGPFTVLSVGRPTQARCTD